MTEEGQTEARSGLGLTKDCVASSRSSLSSDMCERLSCQVQKEESQTTQTAESTMDRLPTDLLLLIIKGSRYGIAQRGKRCLIPSPARPEFNICTMQKDRRAVCHGALLMPRMYSTRTSSWYTAARNSDSRLT